jgi:hypothetical protein
MLLIPNAFKLDNILTSDTLPISCAPEIPFQCLIATNFLEQRFSG